MGSRSRLRHAYLEAVQARAEHAERTREEEARLRVTEERMRIARDLHDVVAHHMAVANAQAGTAAHLLETDPELSQEDPRRPPGHHLLGHARAARHRRRCCGRPTTRRATPRTRAGAGPAPRTAGASADPPGWPSSRRRSRANRETLSPGVDLTAYRIIQEALTNVTKYAASATASLRLRYSGTGSPSRSPTTPEPTNRTAATAATASSACGNGPRRSEATCG